MPLPFHHEVIGGLNKKCEAVHNDCVVETTDAPHFDFSLSMTDASDKPETDHVERGPKALSVSNPALTFENPCQHQHPEIDTFNCGLD